MRNAVVGVGKTRVATSHFEILKNGKCSCVEKCSLYMVCDGNFLRSSKVKELQELEVKSEKNCSHLPQLTLIFFQ